MPPLAPLDRLEALPVLDAPAERRRMLVVVNPYATAVSARMRGLVLHALEGRYEVDAVDTAGRDHATVLARQAAGDGYDVVAVLGGDGTVNEAANRLAGPPPALTRLPGRGTNVYH